MIGLFLGQERRERRLRARRLRGLRSLRAHRRVAHDAQELCDESLLEEPQNYERARWHRNNALREWIRMDDFKERLDHLLPFTPKGYGNA